MSQQQFIIEVDSNLSRKQQKIFLARLLEVGSLNSDREYNKLRWPNLKKFECKFLDER